MFNRRELILLILMALLQFTHVIDFMIMMPLGPVLMKQFKIDSQQFSYLVSSYTIAASLSGFAAIFYLDLFNKKRLLMGFFLGFSIATFVCGLSSGFVFMLGARFFTGLFGGVIGALVFAIVSDLYDSSKRGTAMGIVMSGFSFASVFGVPFSLMLANKYDWHTPFFFLSGLAFFILILISQVVPNRPPLKNQKENSFEKLVSIIKDPLQSRSLFFIFVLFLGQFIIIPFIANSLVANAGLTQTQLPLVYLFGGLASIVGSPIAGRVSDVFSKKKVFAVAAVASSIPVIAITHLGRTDLVVVLSITSLFFFVISFRGVPAIALVSQSSRPETRGAFMSIQSTLINFASAVGAFIAGSIVVTASDGRLLHFEVCGYICVALVLMSIGLIRRIH